MSNLMHKVKDVMTGHHDKNEKHNTHDSKASQKVDDARHTYGPSYNTTKDHGSNQYNSAGAGSNTYGSGTGAGYESGAHHGSNMGTGNYGTGNATGGYSSGTHHDSSMDRMNEPSNTYGSSTTGPTGSGAYGAATGSGTGMGGSGIGGYNSGAQDSSINPSNTYGSSTTGTGNYGAGMGNTSSGTYHDSRKGPMDIGSTGGNYGSGSDNYGSSNMGGYGSSTINAGPHDSKIANKLDPRVDSDLDGRAQHTGNTGSTGHSNTYGSSNPMASTGRDNYGSSTEGYNTRSHASHNMPSQMDSRAEPGYDTRSGQQFGGNATGGSSYNDHSSSTRKTSGPHNSDLLNKLDPRVKESKQDTMANQRGGY
ncbi:hypothetical protein N7467_007619 [Penicillium canescens]|nr:hypothetical protein N7467_007619 [Penicillium canescens]